MVVPGSDLNSGLRGVVVGGPGPAHLSVELLVRVLDVIGNREIRMPSWQCPEGAHVHEGGEIFLEAGADREHDPGRASSKERSVLRIGVAKVQLVSLLLRLVPEVRVQQVVHVLPLDRLMDELDELSVLEHLLVVRGVELDLRRIVGWSGVLRGALNPGSIQLMTERMICS